MRDTDAKIRLQDLTEVLNCISVKRPEAMAEAAHTGLDSIPTFQRMQELLALYSIVGSGAEKYVEALRVLISQRVGNVERLKPGIERRRAKRGKAA